MPSDFKLFEKLSRSWLTEKAASPACKTPRDQQRRSVLMDDKGKGFQTMTTIHHDIVGKHLNRKWATRSRALSSPPSAYLPWVWVLRSFRKAMVSFPLALKDTVQTGYGISRTPVSRNFWDS